MQLDEVEGKCRQTTTVFDCTLSFLSNRNPLDSFSVFCSALLSLSSTVFFVLFLKRCNLSFALSECSCVGACVCVYVHVLRIVSTDKISCFTNTLINY